MSASPYSGVRVNIVCLTKGYIEWQACYMDQLAYHPKCILFYNDRLYKKYDITFPQKHSKIINLLKS